MRLFLVDVFTYHFTVSASSSRSLLSFYCFFSSPLGDITQDCSFTVSDVLYIAKYITARANNFDSDEGALLEDSNAQQVCDMNASHAIDNTSINQLTLFIHDLHSFMFFFVLISWPRWMWTRTASFHHSTRSLSIRLPLVYRGLSLSLPCVPSQVRLSQPRAMCSYTQRDYICS